MDDLISRSALLEEFKRELERGRANDPFFDGTLFHYTGIKAIIENQPTAYNVEQVVKELEERMEKAMSISEKSAELGKAYERHMLYQGGKGNAFDEAIEIVKGGGVNE